MWVVLMFLCGVVQVSAEVSCARPIDTSSAVYSSTSGSVSVNTGPGRNHDTWCPDDTDTRQCLDMALRYTVNLSYIEIHGESSGGRSCRVDRLWLDANRTDSIELGRVNGTNSFTSRPYPALESGLFQIAISKNINCCFRFLLKGCIVDHTDTDSVINRTPQRPAETARGLDAVPSDGSYTSPDVTPPIVDVSSNARATPPSDEDDVADKTCSCCEEEAFRNCAKKKGSSGLQKKKNKEEDGEEVKKAKKTRASTASAAMAEVHAFLRQRASRRKGKKGDLDLEAAEALLFTVLETDVDVTNLDNGAGNLTMGVLEAVSTMMSIDAPGSRRGRRQRMVLAADRFLRKLEPALLKDRTKLTLKKSNCKFHAQRLERRKAARFQFDRVSVIVPPLESNATNGTHTSQVIVAILDSELEDMKESSRITPIVSVNIGAHDLMTSTLDLQFKHVPLDHNKLSPLCVFMKEDLRSSEWSPSGIATTRMTDDSTVCKSSHLTNFAIIMQPVELTVSLSDMAGLEMTSLIGCGVSLTALSITFLMLIGVRRASRRLYILKNMVFMLLLAQTVFLAGIDKTHNEMLCKTVAVLLHYLFLACIMWMLMQGVELYFRVSDVFNRENYYVGYTMVSYLTPLVIVGVSLIKAYHLYGYEKYCWLSPEEGLVFAFIVPALLVFTVNVLVLVVVMLKFNRVKANAKKTDNQRIKSNIRACVILLPLLGPTWIVGVFAVNSSTVIFQYLFTLLNGLQGMLVLIFHCLLNEDVMTSWKKKIALRQSRVHMCEVKVSSPTQNAWTMQFLKPNRALRSVQDVFTVTTSKVKQISRKPCVPDLCQDKPDLPNSEG
ncbi:adhesion G protein-coupled receptor B1-like [Haliotis rufescens]|uniref:adhesion G protein-coupled receptor B1-like n=1 Tax=Haliotis rufescens TaxID=6454 RepID=UPI00201E7F50|nr:adhesion G protein-coupled receptor B1-like [Haliotis rufescens]